MQVNEILRYETSHYFSIGLVDEKELVENYFIVLFCVSGHSEQLFDFFLIYIYIQCLGSGRGEVTGTVKSRDRGLKHHLHFRMLTWRIMRI